MARLHRSYRLEESLLAEVDAWAEAHGMKPSAAIEALLRAGIEDSEPRTNPEESETNRRGTGEELPQDVAEVLRAQADALAAQLLAKDRQLEAKDAQISQLMEQASTLMRLTANAQTLQAAAEQRALMAGTTEPPEEAEAVRMAEERPQDGDIEQTAQESMPSETGPQAASQGRRTGILEALARWFGGE